MQRGVKKSGVVLRISDEVRMVRQQWKDGIAEVAIQRQRRI